ncbi:MAG: carboxypeptidase-like regulatory domain-containing protein, partial [Chloroflexota bacterium]
PDTFTVQAGAAHHVVVSWSAGRSNPDPFATGPLVVGSSSISGVSIVLPLGSSVSGIVTGTGGVALPGVYVFAVPVSGGIWEFGPGGAYTNAQGKFTLTGLANGKYHLQFNPPEGSPYAAGYWSGTGYTSTDAKAAVLTMADTTAPGVTAPSLRFLVGYQVQGTKVPIGLRWSAADPGSNVKSNRLQRQVNGGTWATVISPLSTDVIGSIAANGSSYRFRTRATDYSGRTSVDKAGPTVKPVIKQQTATGTTYKKSWTTATVAGSGGGSYRRTSVAGASVSYRFTGRGIAWVAATGAGFGKATVSIDGGTAITVDLGSAPMLQRIVFGRTFSTSATHTIRIVNLATAGRPQIDVDAFVVLK